MKIYFVALNLIEKQSRSTKLGILGLGISAYGILDIGYGLKS